MLDHGVW